MLNQDDDFNPREAIAALSANLEQPDKFAQIFCEAAKKQKAIDGVLKETFKDLLKHDKDTIDCIKDIQRAIDKEDWKSFLRKIGGLGWAVILLVIGAVLQGLSRKYLG